MNIPEGIDNTKATLNGNWLKGFNFVQAKNIIVNCMKQVIDEQAEMETIEGVRAYKSKILPKGEMRIYFDNQLYFIIKGLKE